MNKNNQGLKVYLDWLVVIGWLWVIYYFSSQPNLKSQLEPLWDLIFRKLAHISEYFVLTYFLAKALKNYLLTLPIIMLSAGVGALLVAALDESHQLFVLGRAGSPVDLLIDSVGVITLLLGIMFTRNL